jgi:hypothetical protein
MHTLSALRDVALATRHANAFLVACQDRNKSGVHKDVLAEMKALDGIATKAVGDVKGRIKGLKEKLGEGGWLDRVLGWTFGSAEEEEEEADEVAKGVAALVGGRGGAEEWAGRVLEGWIESVKGWGFVKMEI